jgi:hypothetical protein
MLLLQMDKFRWVLFPYFSSVFVDLTEIPIKAGLIDSIKVSTLWRTVEIYLLIMHGRQAPASLLKKPETFCSTSIKRRSRSAWLLSNGTDNLGKKEVPPTYRRIFILLSSGQQHRHLQSSRLGKVSLAAVKGEKLANA